MPRGRRAASEETLEQQIVDIDTEIENLRNRITAAKEKRKTLVEKKKDTDIAALLAAVKESGKSAEEVIALLRGTSEA